MAKKQIDKLNCVLENKNKKKNKVVLSLSEFLTDYGTSVQPR